MNQVGVGSSHCTALDHFGLSPADLLGEGVESWVYGLDAERVLRVPKMPRPEEIAARADFLALIGRTSYPFAVPRVLDWGRYDDICYTVEVRISGAPFNAVLGGLTEEARHTALSNFVGALDALAAPSYADLPFGNLLGEQTPNTSWADYLLKKTRRVLEGTRQDLLAAIPELPAVLLYFEQELEAVPSDHAARHLAHGDYYPGNVLIGEDLQITGVIDFSPLTVIGDPDIDRACALAYLIPEMSEGAIPSDRSFLRDLLVARYGAGILRKIRLYELYYALLFSDCEPFDPRTYRWCLEILSRPHLPI